MAAPVVESKPFKFQLKAAGKEVYLTTTGTGTTNKASAVDCTISGGALTCGPNKGGVGSMMHSKMVVGKPNGNNRGWAISPSNEITYKPGGTAYHITVLKSSAADMWLEACDSHPDAGSYAIGKAYAIYE
jgi:hypothetical protein